MRSRSWDGPPGQASIDTPGGMNHQGFPSQAARRGFLPERTAGIEVPADPDIARLHIGDPCFDTPRHIVDAAVAAMRHGYTHYPPPAGDPELRAAVAARVSRVTGRSIDAAQVLVTAGTTEGIFSALTALLDPGDEVLLFDPSYSLYAAVVNQIGATPVYVRMTDDLRPDLQALSEAITEKTRMLIINNPVNPTGVVIDRAELDAIGRLAREHDLLVLADEIYDELVYTDGFASCLHIDDLAGRLLYLNGFSKTYAMPGWRLGYLVAAPELLQPVQVVHANCVAGVNWPAQRAGIAALQGPRQPVDEMIAGYHERRAALLAGLAGTPGLEPIPPQGAFYLYVKFRFSALVRSAEVTRRLLAAGVAVRSGTEYGPAGEGYLRLSYSAGFEDIRKGADRLHRVFEELTEG